MASLRRIRPAGEPLPAPLSLGDLDKLRPDGYRPVFVQSGTAALALALVAVRETCSFPERRVVLLPAYACPDLVSAVDYAGLAAEVVDTVEDEPFISLDLLRRRLDESVLALVGAHFLGLPERMAALAGLCGEAGVALVEDSAQRIPVNGGDPSAAALVVMSFGRGKPAGAIGGGALLVADERPDLLAAAQKVPVKAAWELPPRLRRWAYNSAIRPGIYGLVSRLPGLHVGKTAYRELEGISFLSPDRTACCLAGWAAATCTPTSAQRELRARLGSLPGIIDLAAGHATGDAGPLLRYPLLLPDRAIRDRAWRELDAAGLGASFMYGAALPDLPGVHAAGAADAARHFADRLLTLPVHSGVSSSHVERMLSLLAGVLRQG